MNTNGRDPALPTRASIEGAEREYLHKGSWSKADIYILPGEGAHGGAIVIKDFAHKPVLIRLIGRLQNSRECAAYEALRGLDGIARWLGRIDAHALALERLEGTPLRKFRKNAARRDLLASLRRILDT